MDEKDPIDWVGSLKKLRLIPGDSFLTDGRRFTDLVLAPRSSTSVLIENQSALKDVVSRIQDALRRLGFYEGEVDGWVGPKTAAAFGRYVEEFNPQLGDPLGLADVEELERLAGLGFASSDDYAIAASAGFSSKQEFEAAKRQGFSTRSQMLEANEAGFQTLSEFTNARSAGFRTRDEMEVARGRGFNSKGQMDAAAAAGFDSASDYNLALRGGFNNARDFRAAVNAGFDTGAGYQAFVQSGFATKAEYETALRLGFKTKAAFDDAERDKRSAAVERATTILSDVEAFLSANPNAPILDIAEHVTSLKQALGGRSADEITALLVKLETFMDGVDGYRQFADARQAERVEQERQALASAVTKLERLSTFARTWMAANITHEAIQDLLPLTRESEAALQDPDRPELEDIERRINAIFRQHGLAAELERGLSVPSEQVPTGDDGLRQALTVTGHNRFLLDGDLSDIIVAYNASETAPHVLKNIRGDLVFESGAAIACYFGKAMNDAFLTEQLATRIEALGVKDLRIEPSPCSPEDLKGVDLVLLSRDQFLKTPITSVLAFLKLVEAGSVRHVTTLTVSELSEATHRDQLTALEISKELETGARSGFGLLRIRSDATGFLCGVASDNSHDTHRRILMELGANLKVPDDRVEFLSTEAVFAGIQRKHCGLVYANASDLRDIIGALARDQIPYDVIPLWIETTRVTATQKQIEQEKNEAVRQTEQANRRTAEQQALEIQRQADLAAQRKTKESKLRVENGSRARALQNDLSRWIGEFLAGVNMDARAVYPRIAEWRSHRLADHWELASQHWDIEDYGVSNWSGRQLESIVLKVTFQNKSAQLGRYEEDCFLIGAISDAEFAMIRSPIEASCDAGDASLGRWKIGNEFQSKWKAE